MHFIYLLIFILNISISFFLKNFETCVDALLNIPPDFSIEPLNYESVPGEKKTLADYSSWDFKRHGRDIFLEGNYTFAQDMDNTFLRGIDSYYSITGINFQKMAFTLPEEPLCDFYNTSYRKYVEPHFLGKTNFPQVPPEGLCPIPKGNYWAKGVVLKEDVLPKHLPRGYWRLEERFYSTVPERSMVGGLRVYVKVVERD